MGEVEGAVQLCAAGAVVTIGVSGGKMPQHDFISQDLPGDRSHLARVICGCTVKCWLGELEWRSG